MSEKVVATPSGATRVPVTNDPTDAGADLQVPQNPPEREDGDNLIQPPTPHQQIANVIARKVDGSDADRL